MVCYLEYVYINHLEKQYIAVRVLLVTAITKMMLFKIEIVYMSNQNPRIYHVMCIYVYLTSFKTNVV